MFGAFEIPEWLYDTYFDTVDSDKSGKVTKFEMRGFLVNFRAYGSLPNF